MKNDKWKVLTITPDSYFFPIFQKAIKQAEPGKKSIEIRLINKDRSQKLRTQVKETFMFLFDWQDENKICGVEVLKKFEEE